MSAVPAAGSNAGDPGIEPMGSRLTPEQAADAVMVLVDRAHAAKVLGRMEEAERLKREAVAVLAAYIGDGS